jgi:hypothetical protein
MFTIYHPTADFSQETFLFVGKLFEKVFGYHTTKYGIAEILETLIMVFNFKGSRRMFCCKPIQIQVFGSEPRKRLNGIGELLIGCGLGLKKRKDPG